MKPILHSPAGIAGTRTQSREIVSEGNFGHDVDPQSGKQVLVPFRRVQKHGQTVKVMGEPQQRLRREGVAVGEMNALRPEKRDRVLSRHELERLLRRVQEPLFEDQLVRGVGPVSQVGRKSGAPNISNGIGVQVAKADVGQIGKLVGEPFEQVCNHGVGSGIRRPWDSLRRQRDLSIPVDIAGILSVGPGKIKGETVLE